MVVGHTFQCKITVYKQFEIPFRVDVYFKFSVASQAISGGVHPSIFICGLKLKKSSSSNHAQRISGRDNRKKRFKRRGAGTQSF